MSASVGKQFSFSPLAGHSHPCTVPTAARLPQVLKPFDDEVHSKIFLIQIIPLPGSPDSPVNNNISTIKGDK